MAFRVRALQKGELDSLLLCFQDAFGVDDQSIAIVRNSLVNDPYFHPDRVRVGVLNGSVVSHTVILHRSVYVGTQVITVAGITAVATHPACQGQGFGSRVMQDTLRLIKRQGYDLAMLTTRVPGFFARFGFREVPKIAGFECPASALARLNADLASRGSVQELDYSHDWRVIHSIYSRYSTGLTGLQVRDARFWETWPRRGTFPHGLSPRLGAIGLLARIDGQASAYVAAHVTPEHEHLTFTQLGHLPGHEDVAIALLSEGAKRYLSVSSGRAILHIGGNEPVAARLQAIRVPLTVEVSPGLMVLFPNRDWLRPAGLRSPDEAIERLFRSDPPILWHRDGY